MIISFAHILAIRSAFVPEALEGFVFSLTGVGDLTTTVSRMGDLMREDRSLRGEMDLLEDRRGETDRYVALSSKYRLSGGDRFREYGRRGSLKEPMERYSSL
jgi:hypothetical protein